MKLTAVQTASRRVKDRLRRHGNENWVWMNTGLYNGVRSSLYNIYNTGYFAWFPDDEIIVTVEE